MTVAYLAVAGVAAAHHELWRDEVQAWLIARDSSSLPDLLRNLDYDGHPALWHLTLMPLTRIAESPGIMLVWHLAIAGALVGLVARYAPFSRLQRALFPFGFYVVFEYSVKARSYALGWLLLVAFCLLFPNRYRRFVWIGVVLMLAAQTAALPLIVVIAVAMGLALDVWLARRRGDDRLAGTTARSLWIGFGLIGVGVATSIAQIVPPPDWAFAPDWFFGADPERAADVLDAATRMWLPFGSEAVGRLPDVGILAWIVFPGVTAWMAIQLRHRPAILVMYLLGTAGLLAFFYTRYLGDVWHHGHLYIVFFVAAWLERTTRDASRTPSTPWGNRVTDLLVTCLLVVHVVAGARAVRMELNRPYSNGGAVASFIETMGWKNRPIVGEADFAVSTVVGHLGVERVYYPRGDRWGSFVVWDVERFATPPDAEVLEAARRIGDDALVVANRPLDGAALAEFGAVEVARFTGAVWPDEDFYLYRARVPEGFTETRRVEDIDG